MVAPLSNLNTLYLSQMFYSSRGILSSLRNSSITSIQQQKGVISLLQSKAIPLSSKQMSYLNLVYSSLGIGNNVNILY